MSVQSLSPFRHILHPRPSFARIVVSEVSVIQSCAGVSAGKDVCRVPAGKFAPAGCSGMSAADGRHLRVLVWMQRGSEGAPGCRNHEIRAALV